MADSTGIAGLSSWAPLFGSLFGGSSPSQQSQNSQYGSSGWMGSDYSGGRGKFGTGNMPGTTGHACDLFDRFLSLIAC